MEIDYRLQKDIEAYCELNDISDSGKFASELLRKAFNVEKYGERPFIREEKQEDMIKKETTEPVTERTIIEEPKEPDRTEAIEEPAVTEEKPKPRKGRPKKKPEEKAVQKEKKTEEKPNITIDREFWEKNCSLCSSEECDGTVPDKVSECSLWKQYVEKKNKPTKRKLK